MHQRAALSVLNNIKCMTNKGTERGILIGQPVKDLGRKAYRMKKGLPIETKITSKNQNKSLIKFGEDELFNITNGRDEQCIKMKVTNKSVGWQQHYKEYVKDENGDILTYLSDNNGKRIIFKNYEEWEVWSNRECEEMKNILGNKLTPEQQYVSLGMGMERPFTGDYWDFQDIGWYHCTLCDIYLFMWEHKYKSDIGYPTFWSHIPNAIQYKQDNITKPNYTQSYQPVKYKGLSPSRRCICSNVLYIYN